MKKTTTNAIVGCSTAVIVGTAINMYEIELVDRIINSDKIPEKLKDVCCFGLGLAGGAITIAAGVGALLLNDKFGK